MDYDQIRIEAVKCSNIYTNTNKKNQGLFFFHSLEEKELFLYYTEANAEAERKVFF